MHAYMLTYISPFLAQNSPTKLPNSQVDLWSPKQEDEACIVSATMATATYSPVSHLPNWKVHGNPLESEILKF